MAEWKLSQDQSGIHVHRLDLESGAKEYEERAFFSSGEDLEAVVAWVMEQAADGDYALLPDGSPLVILDTE